MIELIDAGKLYDRANLIALIMHSAHHLTVKDALIYIQDIAQKLKNLH